MEPSYINFKFLRNEEKLINSINADSSWDENKTLISVLNTWLINLGHKETRLNYILSYEL